MKIKERTFFIFIFHAVTMKLEFLLNVASLDSFNVIEINKATKIRIESFNFLGKLKYMFYLLLQSCISPK